jgi:DNA-binding XRE family transcriptional regulator
LNERITQLREIFELNKTAFGKKIELSQQSITQFEQGKNTPSKRTIALICDRFGVNEEWLRNGVGEMFKPKRVATKEEDLSYIRRDLDKLNEKYVQLVNVLIKDLIALRDGTEADDDE